MDEDGKAQAAQGTGMEAQNTGDALNSGSTLNGESSLNQVSSLNNADALNMGDTLNQTVDLNPAQPVAAGEAQAAQPMTQPEPALTQAGQALVQELQGAGETAQPATMQQTQTTESSQAVGAGQTAQPMQTTQATQPAMAQAATQAAQPTLTGQPMMNQTQALTGAHTPQKKSHTKMLLIILVVLLVAAGLTVAGVMFLPKLLGANYEESYEVATQLDAKLEEIYVDDESECGQMAEMFRLGTATTEEFDEHVTGCKVQMSEARQLVEELGETSAVKKDDDLKTEYADFRKAANTTLPDDTQLDKEMGWLSETYAFLAKLTNLDLTVMTVADISEMTQPLRESENETLEEFGQGMQERLEAMRNTYELAMLAEANGDSSAEQATLMAQFEELQNWVAEREEEIDNAVPMLAKTAMDETTKSFEDFYKTLSNLKKK